MFSSLNIDDRACQAKIDHEDGVWVITQAHHDIVGFDVLVDVVLFVHVLNALQKLMEQHQGSFQAKFLPTEIE